MARFKQVRDGIRQSLRDLMARLVYHLAPGTVLRDRRYFDLWQRKGFHALKVHFYSPIPDTRELTEAQFTRRSELPGIAMNDAAQVALLEQFQREYHAEYSRFPVEATADPAAFFLNNRNFSPADAALLYSMVRHFRPKRVIEIGLGFSSLVISQALRENEKAGAPAAQFTSIDPYPRAQFQKGIPALTELLVQPVQAVPLARFAELGPNDLLFIDSSHVLKIGSDVQYEYLELLPRLNAGVVVHVHDIFFPCDYPRYMLEEKRWFWQEQYLLQALLCHNPRFEVLLAGHYLELTQEALYTAALGRTDFTDHGCSSFWFRRVT